MSAARMARRVLVALIATGGVMLLSACENRALPSSTVAVSSARSGVLPRFMRLRRFGRVVRDDRKPGSRGVNDLLVDDFGTDKVEILKNNSWKEIAEISDGIAGPDGNYVDANGNFYVANYLGPNITEYKPKTTQPSFTYKNAMTDPVGVSADAGGNVYEADYNGGFVGEYAQGVDSVVAACFPGGQVEGVAIDRSNDVFVAYNRKNDARIIEYMGGLTGCSGKLLGAKLEYAGGLAIDKDGNLIVCDQATSTVDVIPPPYQRVSKTLGSGFEDPFHVTLNRSNTLVFVADVAWGDVQVLDYPSGAGVAELGPSNGISDATSAVDGQNAVY